MCGLNLCALPHAPKYEVGMNEMEGNMKENIIKSPLHKEYQGENLTQTKQEKETI